jgi:hypothetical protein
MRPRSYPRESSLRKAMLLAQDFGWKLPEILFQNTKIPVLHLTLDNTFWESLGKAESWEHWEPHRRSFIEHLASGQEANSFFKHILK